MDTKERWDKIAKDVQTKTQKQCVDRFKYFIHTYIHTYTHTYIVYIHTYIHVCSMDTKERWDKIAKDVQTKTQKQCVDRFKYLRKEAQRLKDIQQAAAEVCMYVCMYVCMCIYTYVYTNTCMYICEGRLQYLRREAQRCMYVCIYTHVYVCVYM